MDSTTAMKLSRAIKTIETCAPNVYDADSYRDGDFPRLLDLKQVIPERVFLK
jgi:hypothetical protein